MDVLELRLKADEFFIGREYSQALFYYSLLLEKKPNDKEIEMYVILSDLASENEEEAQALFDYYDILKNNNEEVPLAVIEDIIDSFNEGSDFASLLENTLNSSLKTIDGIEYKDFKKLVNIHGNFKNIFENVMFSTKVVIVTKDDFIDFLNNLIENDFKTMAFNYLESANEMFPYDDEVRELFNRMEKIN